MSPTNAQLAPTPPDLPPGVRLHPGFLDGDASARLRRMCLDELDWQRPEVSLFGRRHRVPRRVAFVAPAGRCYRYSGTCHVGAGVPSAFSELIDAVAARVETSFDSILASHYRDGSDCVGWHRDDERELGPDPVVAILSLGASRTLSFRPRGGGPRHDLHFEDGALLVMGPGVQSQWEHALPRRARAGERISLGFRQLVPSR